ncbi:hypothetical protein HOY82DRAFT_618484 [Tuber indicum]|nr:hypothetical protein HOY82DRAFT_618484 [Tuber indicum]
MLRKSCEPKRSYDSMINAPPSIPESESMDLDAPTECSERNSLSPVPPLSPPGVETPVPKASLAKPQGKSLTSLVVHSEEVPHPRSWADEMNKEAEKRRARQKATKKARVLGESLADTDGSQALVKVKSQTKKAEGQKKEKATEDGRKGHSQKLVSVTPSVRKVRVGMISDHNVEVAALGSKFGPAARDVSYYSDAVILKGAKRAK